MYVPVNGDHERQRVLDVLRARGGHHLLHFRSGQSRRSGRRARPPRGARWLIPRRPARGPTKGP
jgi:hypothetical protein